MDENFRKARLIALADPASKYNIMNLATAAVRSGFFQPLERGGERSGRRFSFLAAQAYIAAERLRARSVESFSHFPQWTASQQNHTIRRLLARALVGGLNLDSLRTLLFEIGADIPVALWSPDGQGFDEIIRPLGYHNTGTGGDDYIEVYIVYQSFQGELEVTLLDCIAEVRSHQIMDEDGNRGWEDRLDNYVANVYRGFTAEDLGDEDIERISRDLGMDEQDIRGSIKQPIGLAQAAFDYHHQHGTDSIDDYPLTFGAPAEVRRHFMLELVMQDRGFLH